MAKKCDSLNEDVKLKFEIEEKLGEFVPYLFYPDYDLSGENIFKGLKVQGIKFMKTCYTERI